MMKQILVIIAVVVGFASCEQQPARRELPKNRRAIIPEKDFPKDKLAPIDIPPPPAPYTGPKRLCFEMEQGNEAHEMTRMDVVLDDNDSMRGTLEYVYADRPARRGTVEGMKEGKFIELDYTYTDSGVAKIEQLVLKMDDDKLYKKNGILVEEEGRLVLENPLKASLQLFLLKTECK